VSWGRLSIATKLYVIFGLLATTSATMLALALLLMSGSVGRTVIWLLALGGVVAAGLGAAALAVLTVEVLRPLARITRVTAAVAGGATGVTIPYAERGDEIGALARSIATFPEALRHNAMLAKSISEAGEARERRQELIATEIMQFSADVEATMAELGRIADTMLATATHLSSTSDQASSRTATAAASSNEASANVRDIAAAADELAMSVSEIDRQVAQSTAIATKAADETVRTNKAVQQLDEAASRIGHVTRLITEIAEQTNLLALNATIEAARAGESGRGFAVVANEVKALAGQTAKATEEIAGQIAGMQRATDLSIDAVTAIERTIREIGEISEAIAAAVTQQGAATQEIARSVETAAKRTSETAEQVRQAGRATVDTSEDAGRVKTVSDDLGAVARRIHHQVEQFFQRLRAA